MADQLRSYVALLPSQSQQFARDFVRLPEFAALKVEHRSPIQNWKELWDIANLKADFVGSGVGLARFGSGKALPGDGGLAKRKLKTELVRLQLLLPGIVLQYCKPFGQVRDRFSHRGACERLFSRPEPVLDRLLHELSLGIVPGKQLRLDIAGGTALPVLSRYWRAADAAAI